jgi:hypothetical protein
MADAITNARQVIENRIREIEEETKRLKRAWRSSARAARGAVRAVGRRARGGCPGGEDARLPRAASAGSSSSPTWSGTPGARSADIARGIGTPANVQNVLRRPGGRSLSGRNPGGGYRLVSAAPTAEKPESSGSA